MYIMHVCDNSHLSWCKRLSTIHKRRQTQAGGLSSADKGDGRLHFLAKNRIFPNLWRVRTDKGGEPVRTMGEGSIFRDLCGLDTQLILKKDVDTWLDIYTASVTIFADKPRCWSKMMFCLLIIIQYD